MPAKRPPRDPNELAKYILDVTTGEAERSTSEEEPCRSGFSRTGSSKGGKARAKKLSSKKRKAITKKATNGKWRKATLDRSPLVLKTIGGF